MYCLFTPDGFWQPTTLSPDFPTCVGVIKMLHKAGLGKSLHELTVIGKFKILPIKISFIQDGDENKAFNKFDSKLN
jgi:hypothetical protein